MPFPFSLGVPHLSDNHFTVLGNSLSQMSYAVAEVFAGSLLRKASEASSCGAKIIIIKVDEVFYDLTQIEMKRTSTELNEKESTEPFSQYRLQHSPCL